MKKVSLKKNKTVFVGVSGGVDSSVSLALLKDAGYDVVGVFIRTWTPEWIACTWRDERRDAMRVCAFLDVPFLECDAVEAYKTGVADYMISEYRAGRVPNPDVMCNREVKFGVFWEFARARGANYIATGHYARVENTYELCKGVDSAKDQSYFLWTLTEDDLSHTLFPVGHLQKSEVRVLAEKYGLPTATKKDSQGVCFLGPLDMKDFLSHYITPVRGDVLDEEGQVIGYHDGAVFFTLGERHGFTITKKGTDDPRYFVIAKNVEKNTITVSKNTPDESAGAQNMYTLSRVTFRQKIEKEKVYAMQIRYHGELIPATIEENNETVFVHFKKPILASSGQSVVIYDGEVCVGGGILN